MEKSISINNVSKSYRSLQAALSGGAQSSVNALDGVSLEVDCGELFGLIAPIYSQIEPFKKRRAGKLSGGMKQKLALSCALVHRPSVLFLDEPTTGVDAVSRVEFWEMLDSLRAQGITIFVSTPYMDEAARCDRIAFVNEGKILEICSPPMDLENYFISLIQNG